ncbi:MAG: hypothetical protein WA959_17410 [Rivularia sp. (in: cyanobacteria)]
MQRTTVKILSGKALGNSIEVKIKISKINGKQNNVKLGMGDG